MDVLREERTEGRKEAKVLKEVKYKKKSTSVSIPVGMGGHNYYVCFVSVVEGLCLLRTECSGGARIVVVKVGLAGYVCVWDRVGFGEVEE